MAPPAELLRAHELCSRGQHREAETILRAWLEAHPNDKTALDLLGFVLYFQARYAEAEAACLAALALVPGDAYATKGLGLCVAKLGRIDEALVLLERAAERSPNVLDAYWDWTVVLIEAGRKDEARRVIRRGRAALPERETEWEKLERAIDAG